MGESNGSFSRKELSRVAQALTLNQLTAFERRMVTISGAWVCRLRLPEAKYMMSRHIFQWAEHVDALRKRLSEMPGGKPETKVSAELEQVLQESLFAEDEEHYMMALYDVFLPELRAKYRMYIAQTKELPDRPTVKRLEEILTAIDEQIASGLAHIKEHYGAAAEAAQWGSHIRRLLQSAGGITGEGADATELKSLLKHAADRYEFPEMQHRSKTSYYSYKHPIEDYQWSKTLQGEPWVERVALAVWLYNEMDACEYISTILYETDNMPWEFHFDVARHAWDESRHSEFGYTLLKQFGFHPEEFEVWVATYMSSMKLEPHERYTAVTCWYEPGSFMVKPSYLERLAQEVGGEDLVVELLKFDLADERLHVSFGSKWVPTLMERYGVTMEQKDFVEAIKAKGTKLRQEQEAAFVNTMPDEKRHSMNSIKEHLEKWAEARGSRVIVS